MPQLFDHKPIPALRIAIAGSFIYIVLKNAKLHGIMP